MSFKDKNWNARFQAMGDEAEGIFEQVYPNGFTRYGLDRPPIQMHKLEPFIRYTPDYLTSQGPVEVQGFGYDQVAKIKVDKLEALLMWDAIQPTRLFLWDSHQQRHAMLAIDEVKRMVKHGDVTVQSFPEGKEYYAIPAARIGGWVDYEPEETDDE